MTTYKCTTCGAIIQSHGHGPGNCIAELKKHIASLTEGLKKIADGETYHDESMGDHCSCCDLDAKMILEELPQHNSRRTG